MRIDAGAGSDVGRLRTGNEDSFLVDDRLELYAVADGMGGHNAGEVASATALEALRAAVASGKSLDAAITLANSAIFEKAATDQGLAGMGTTLTAVVLGESTMLIGHVGDSRAYRIRGATLEQLTEDHSLVEELVREGRLSPAEAEVHPRRSVITRALGIDARVEVDLYTIDAQTGDRILLCSDGLTTMLRDEEVLRIAAGENDPRLAADRLIDAANEAGGEDNITVLIIDVLDAPPPAPPDPEALAARTSVSRTPVPVAAPDVVLEEPKPRRSRMRSLASLMLYVLPVLAIVGIGIGAINWYANNTYFVDFRGDRVVVYQGVPGGILGWQPTVEITTELRRSQLTPDAIDQIDKSGKGSLERAEQFVANLERSSTTTTSTTSTTRPTGTTTTTRAGGT